MAIPISEYIDIKSKFVLPNTETRDFVGLVFTKANMLAKADDADHTTTKGKYDGGTPVMLTRDQVTEYFDGSSDEAKFLASYFGYNGGNSTPSYIYVAKVLADETALAAYTRVLALVANFGSFTFLGVTEGLLDVAKANDSEQTVMIVRVSSDDNTSEYKGLEMTHVVLSEDTTAAWMAMAWYASVDYIKRNASATIDYKQFSGATPSVTTLADKRSLDANNVNYVGLVQVNGRQLSFYQTGVNANGVDTGVIRDKVWIEGSIQAGWFAMAGSQQKIPANEAGAVMVENMIIGVATQGVENGTILIDKPLTQYQIGIIRDYTENSDTAISDIQTNGYYIDTQIISKDNKYICEYTLVYAKGDHIGKVAGTHYLV